jgi:hypothetical protein
MEPVASRASQCSRTWGGIAMSIMSLSCLLTLIYEELERHMRSALDSIFSSLTTLDSCEKYLVAERLRTVQHRQSLADWVKTQGN